MPQTESTRRGESSGLSQFRIALAFLLVSLVFRLPWFFDAVINWDEGTYLLMGQDMLNGHLPYTELWELKPPANFAFFAASIATFGKQIWGIRLAGALCVAFTGYAICRCTQLLVPGKLGIWVGILSIVTSSLAPVGQATMSETPATAWLAASLWMLLSRRTPGGFFATGLLMGIATLTRLNLAYPAVLMGACILAMERAPSFLGGMRKASFYAIGGVSALLCLILPYAIADELPLLWKTLVVAPGHYSVNQDPIWMNLARQGAHAFGFYRKIALGQTTAEFVYELRGTSLFVYGGTLLAILTFRRCWRSKTDSYRTALSYTLALTASIGLSIALGGKAHEHYMLQIIPFCALIAMLAYREVTHGAPRHRHWAGLALLALTSLHWTVVDYSNLFRRLAQGNLQHGAAYEIERTIRTANVGAQPVLITTTAHVTYWLLGKRPPTIAAHPSILDTDWFLNSDILPSREPKDELERLMATSPAFVVVSPNLPFFPNHPKAQGRFIEVLNGHYELVRTIEDQQVYRLLSAD